MDMTLDTSTEDDIGLAEPEHIEMMFDALDDTISGTESYSLTSAQLYAQSVLLSNRMATRADMVSGVEGFFSKIGDGVKAIWEYIQKLFKGIWNWFFGPKEKKMSILEETEAHIKASQERLAGIANARGQAISDSFMKTMREHLAAAEKNGTPEEKKKAEEGIQLLQLGYEKGHKEFKIKEVVEIAIKINSRGQKALDEICERAANEYKGYISLIEHDHSDKFSGTAFEDDYKNYRKWTLEHKDKPLDAYIKIPKGINSLHAVTAAQDSLQKVIKDLESERSGISSTFKAAAIDRIKSLEEKVKRPEMQEHNREKFRKDLTACKLFLSLTTQAIKQIERTAENVKRIDDSLLRLCGLKPTK